MSGYEAALYLLNLPNQERHTPGHARSFLARAASVANFSIGQNAHGSITWRHVNSVTCM